MKQSVSLVGQSCDTVSLSRYTLPPVQIHLNMLTYINLSTYKRISHNKKYPIQKVDLSHVENKSQLFQRIASAFNFPEYFGHNWDAFHDCFADLLLASKQEQAIIFAYQKILA